MSPERWAFSPETYALTARRDEWSNALARLSMECEATTTDDVAGTLTVRRFAGSFTAARLSAPPQIISARAAASAMRWLATPLEGEVHLAHDNRPSKLAPDDILFGDVSALTPLVVHTHSQLLLVGFPTSALRSRLLNSLSPLRVRLPSNAVGARVVSGLMRTVAAAMEDMHEEMARPIETNLLDLLAQMLVSAGESSPESGAGGMRRGTARTLQRIRAAMEQRLGDPTLTIADIAAAERTSVRYVQKLFERDGESFLHFVRMRRLDRAREDLTDPAHSHLSISDICFRWGFNDAAHFSRAFHDAFGVSPRNFRRAATAEMADRILQHANRGWPEAPHLLKRKKALADDAAAATTGDCTRIVGRSGPQGRPSVHRTLRAPAPSPSRGDPGDGSLGLFQSRHSSPSSKSTAVTSSPSRPCRSTPATITTAWFAGTPAPNRCFTGRPNTRRSTVVVPDPWMPRCAGAVPEKDSAFTSVRGPSPCAGPARTTSSNCRSWTSPRV